MEPIYLFFETTLGKGMPEIPVRQAYLAQIAHPEERARYCAASRALFRAAAFLALDATAFFYQEDGRPVLPGAQVSLSHAGEMALCAISRERVGVDLERRERRIPPQVLRRVGAQAFPGETALEKWLAWEARRKAAGPQKVRFLSRGDYRIAVCASALATLYDGDTGKEI